MSDGDYYAAAWEWCNNNIASFNQYHEAQVRCLMDRDHDVVIDNTNVSAKVRTRYLAWSRFYRRRVIGVLFPIALQTVLDRQYTRPDKCVPADAVRRQYHSISLPLIGHDVDEIFVKFPDKVCTPI